MKKFSLQFLSILFLAFTAISIVSCGDDDDDDNSDPCANVTCDAGFTCVNGSCVADSEVQETVTGQINENTTWTSDKIYLLDKKVVVQSGATLTIEPGTIIKGKPGDLSDASALIIAKGGMIMAEGTAERPIIFTAEEDNITIGQTSGTNMTKSDRGKWGGLIILGEAPSSVKGTDQTGQIEGVPATIPNTTYGGTVENDNSGVLKYVSIRHGGIKIANGNEINGLTLGGVGNGTTIENIEVISNFDDGIECFGGTVNLSNVVVAYCGDDALDFDQNYAGTFTNVVIVQDGSAGETDEAFEFDGPEGSTYTTGKFTVTGATLISVDGSGSGADLKSKAQGLITNTSWRGYSKFVKVRAAFDPENDCASKTDAYTKMAAGDLKIENSEVVTDATDVIKVYVDDEDAAELACFEDNAELEAEYQGVADAAITEGGNSIVSTASGNVGADMDSFGWTWTKSNDGF